MLNQIYIRKACLPRHRSPTNFKQISNASKTLGGARMLAPLRIQTLLNPKHSKARAVPALFNPATEIPSDSPSRLAPLWCVQNFHFDVFLMRIIRVSWKLGCYFSFVHIHITVCSFHSRIFFKLFFYSTLFSITEWLAYVNEPWYRRTHAKCSDLHWQCFHAKRFRNYSRLSEHVAGGK